MRHVWFDLSLYSQHVDFYLGLCFTLFFYKNLDFRNDAEFLLIFEIGAQLFLTCPKICSFFRAGGGGGEPQENIWAA